MTARTDLRLVLDQYNRQLTYFRDTAMKLIAAIAAYAGLHASSTAVALTEKSNRDLFLTAHFVLVAFILIIGSANYFRMADTHRTLGQSLGPDGPSLRELGVLRHEPPLVALAWGTLYAAVHGGLGHALRRRPWRLPDRRLSREVALIWKSV
jgi:hypothetical protein